MATLILKATEECNSNCVYCDVVRKDERGSPMSADLLELVFIRLNEFLLERQDEHIKIIWHGGEPLLLGPKYFHMVWELQEKHCRETQRRISHDMQSNLTLFTDDYALALQKLGIKSIGSSYDPEPHVRGPGKEVDSEHYNRMFMRAIRTVEKHGYSWGIIYVVTKKSLAKPKDVFFYLTNLKLNGAINFNPVLIYDDVRQHIAITPEEYAQFLGTIFSLWWENSHRYPNIEPFRSLTRIIRDGKRDLCCADSGNCAYGYFNITPRGQCSHCGRSGDWGLLHYGDIRDSSLEEIMADPQRGQLAERNAILEEGECNNCRFWTICHGGCPLDAYAQHGSFAHKSPWCAAKREFIERYFEPITGIRFDPPRE